MWPLVIPCKPWITLLSYCTVSYGTVPYGTVPYGTILYSDNTRIVNIWSHTHAFTLGYVHYNGIHYDIPIQWAIHYIGILFTISVNVHYTTQIIYFNICKILPQVKVLKTLNPNHWFFENFRVVFGKKFTIRAGRGHFGHPPPGSY